MFVQLWVFDPKIVNSNLAWASVLCPEAKHFTRLFLSIQVYEWVPDQPRKVNSPLVKRRWVPLGALKSALTQYTFSFCSIFCDMINLLYLGIQTGEIFNNEAFIRFTFQFGIMLFSSRRQLGMLLIQIVCKYMLMYFLFCKLNTAHQCLLSVTMVI